MGDGESAVDGVEGNPVDGTKDRTPFLRGVPCLLYSVANIGPKNSTHGSYLIKHECYYLSGWRR